MHLGLEAGSAPASCYAASLDLADFGAEQPLYLGTRNDPPSNQNQKRPGEQSWHLQIPEF